MMKHKVSAPGKASLLFTFFSLFISNFALALPGDIAPRGNPDGKFDAADLIVLQQFVIGNITPTPEEFVAADVAPAGIPDGVIDIADVIVLQKGILDGSLDQASRFILCLPGNGCSQEAYLAGAAYYEEVSDGSDGISIIYFESSKNQLTMEHDSNGKIIGSNINPSYQSPSDATGGSSSDIIGSLNGDFSIAPSGSAIYTIPIVVPPGAGGIQPDLAIAYDSQAGNGILGIGWSLSGLSKITRCPKTLAQDGSIHGGINFTSSDRLCLDGQRLVLITGFTSNDAAYWSSNAEYRTETGSPVKVTRVGTGFKVESMDGSVAEYGNTIDSNQNVRIINTGAQPTLSWAINTITDQYTNNVYFSYTEDVVNGDHYINGINYTGNHAAGIPQSISVLFSYQPRPDVEYGYISGAKVNSLRRLTNIKTFINTITLVRDYRFSYQQEISTDQSRLKTITECSNGTACKLPTTFNWINNADGQFRLTVNTANGNNYGESTIKFVDMNGDGKDDWVSTYRDYTYIRFSNGDGTFQSTIKTSNGNIYGDTTIKLADMNGDGLTDWVSTYRDYTYVRFSKGDGTFQSTIKTSNGNIYGDTTIKLADMNGDSRIDWISTYDTKTYVRFSNGDGTFGSVISTSNGNTYGFSTIKLADMNGDGLTDWVSTHPDYTYVRLSKGDGTFQSAIKTYNGNIYGDTTIKLADMNGDGLVDWVSTYDTITYVRFSRGDGTFEPTVSTANGNTYGITTIKLADMNGDGLSDWVSTYGNMTYIRYSNGDGTFRSVISTSNGNNYGTSTIHLADLNGDGLLDWVSGYLSNTYVRLANGPKSNQLSSIVDGIGNQTSISYKPITDASVHTQNINNSQCLLIEIRCGLHPKYVVSEQSTTDGLNGTSRITYKYGESRINLYGRGDLGFAWTESTNTQTGLVTRVNYRQDYPYIGMVSYEKQMLNGNILQETTNTPQTRNSASNRPIPYVSPVVVKNYDINGNYLSTITTTSIVNEYGDVESTTVSTTDGIDTYNVFTNNTYGLKTSANWCEKGLPTQSTVYKSGPDGTSPTVVSNYTYNTQCKIRTESGSVNGRAGLTKTYGYDGFGHINTTTITGPDITTRVVSTVYDNAGIMPVSVTNEMGHTTTTTYDYRFGVPLTQTDANGLTTSYVYDDFGELTDVYAPGGNRTQTIKQWCTQNCTLPAINGNVQAQVAKFTVTTRYLGGTGSAESYMPEVKVFFDKLGREIRKRTTSYDNKVIYVDTAYDALGRVVATTQPYFSNDNGRKNPSTTVYDTLNRPTSVTTPGEGTTSISYNRFTSTTTRSVVNPVTGVTSYQTNTEIKNVIGQTEEIIDNAGNHLYYEYDAQGNQVRTLMPSLSANGSVVNTKGTVITIGYDEFGRKTSMSDPNMGTWSYTYDTSSKMRTQTDALNQTTTMEYDRAGRMTKRTDHDGTVTHWVYNDDLAGGNTPNTMAIGKLDTVYMVDSSNNEIFRQRLTYTASLGLPDQTTTVIDGVSYQTNSSYDRFHRPETIAYPNTSTDPQNPKRFQLKYAYTNGALNTVQKADGSVTYWQANHRDASGAIRALTLGNGVQQWRDYDVAGRLTWMNFGYSGNVYNANYQYDTLGNLVYRDTQRSGSTQKLEETYGYDSLNRLMNVNINHMGDQSFSYDALGNMRSKTGMGTYEYSGARPNAVSKANNVDYFYNANGALISGAGRHVNWTSFNKPGTIYNDQATSIFHYGPSRARYKHEVIDAQNSAENSTIYYIGGSYEKVVKNGITTHKHYIQAGGEAIAQYTINSSNIEKTEYFHRDNQGSMVAVSDATGRVSGQMDYDAFGRRRPILGSSVVDSIINKIPRGYTGHEHLDKLGLIHMNGRVYDPQLGRFLSADPFVQFANNLQSYNRYSYVLNNPMSYTDPSGFLSKKWKKALGAITAVSFPGSTASVAVMYSKPVRRFFLKYEWARVAGQIAAGVADGAGCGGYCSAAYSAYLTDISGGSFGDAVKAAAVSYATTKAFNTVHGEFNGTNAGDIAKKILTHGTIGGLSSAASGGSFKDGFIGAAVSQSMFKGLESAGFNFYENPHGWEYVYNGAAASLVGGLASSATGGSFEAGAKAALYGRLFNDVYSCGIETTTVAGLAGGKGGYGFYFDDESYDWGLYLTEPKGLLLDAAGVEGSISFGAAWSPSMEAFTGESISSSYSASMIGFDYSFRADGKGISTIGLSLTQGYGRSVSGVKTSTISVPQTGASLIGRFERQILNLYMH